MESHQEILEKLIFEKKTSKRELAKMIGYTSQNTKKHFNKEKYSEKMIEKISTALGIEPSVFTIHAPVTQVGDGNTATVSIGELKEFYEKQLADKDRLIAEKERLIMVLMEKK